jgi:osmotically-inducible protein OsmY
MEMKFYRFPLLLIAALPLLQGCFAIVASGVAVGADVVHDRRSFGRVVQDRNIQLTATDAINRDKPLVRDNNNVIVVVYDGILLLCGQVRSEELKRAAQSHVEKFENVQRVVNEIEVTDDPRGFWRRRQDDTTTGRVKTALLDIRDMPGFDPLRVNVTTSNDNVYLMGLVTHAEAEAATEVARNVNGVDKVVKVFEYTD